VAQDETLAVIPLAQRDEVFLVGATYFPGSSDSIFFVWIDPAIEAARLAQDVLRHHRSVAILSSQQSWEALAAAEFKRAFESGGGAVVVHEEPSFETASVKMEAAKAKRANPEAIFISSYLLFPMYVRELRALRIDAPLFGIELDQGTIDAAQGAADGLVFIAPAMPDKTFAARFKQRFGEDPQIPAAQAYDAARLLVDAMQRVGPDPIRLREHFRNFTDAQGVCGRIRRVNGKMEIDTSLFVVGNKVIRPLSGR